MEAVEAMLELVHEEVGKVMLEQVPAEEGKEMPEQVHAAVARELALVEGARAMLVLVEDASKKMQTKERQEDETPLQLHETNTQRALLDIVAINQATSPIIDLMNQQVNHIQVDEM